MSHSLGFRNPPASPTPLTLWPTHLTLGCAHARKSRSRGTLAAMREMASSVVPEAPSANFNVSRETLGFAVQVPTSPLRPDVRPGLASRCPEDLGLGWRSARSLWVACLRLSGTHLQPLASLQVWQSPGCWMERMKFAGVDGVSGIGCSSRPGAVAWCCGPKGVAGTTGSEGVVAAWRGDAGVVVWVLRDRVFGQWATVPVERCAVGAGTWGETGPAVRGALVWVESPPMD